MASASEEDGAIEIDDGGGDGDNSYSGGGFVEQALPSHHFGPFSPANDSETASPVYEPTHYVDIVGGDDDSFAAHSVETPTGTPNYTGVAGAAGFVAGFSAYPQVAFSETGGESLAANDATFNEDFVTSSTTDGPILPPPANMEPEEGFQLREWKRQNAIQLLEKEKRERELVMQIREEADEYILDFHRRWQLNSETRKASNREKEKLFVANQENCNAEAEKNYWKSVAELIPKEVPNVEKRRGRKEEKNPAVVVTHGPKPGKPTDLSRMRHILLKLKHFPPPHMKLPPPTTGIAVVPPNDSKSSAAAF